MMWSTMQINRGGCHPPRPSVYMTLHIIRKLHSIFYYSFKIYKLLTTLPSRRLSANHFLSFLPWVPEAFYARFPVSRKNLWYPGYLFLGTVSEFTEDALSCLYSSSKRRWHPSSIILAYSCIRSFSFNKKFSFFSSSDSRKLFRHFFKVYFCINISVAAPLPENEVAILFWDNIPYLHFSNTVRAGWVWFMNK